MTGALGHTRRLLALAIVARLMGASGKREAAPIQFENRQVGSGVTFVLDNGTLPDKPMIDGIPGGVALFDYDSDGYLDIFFTNGARLPELVKDDNKYSNRLYRNNHDGTFTDVTDRAGLRGDGYSVGAAAADYDNDGHGDLYVTGYNRNILYHNNGDGTFTDVTGKAGVTGVSSSGKKLWGIAAAWIDFDNDGKLDLFVTNYLDWSFATSRVCGAPGKRLSCSPTLYKGEPNLLYHNNGDGTFTDVSQKAGILKPGPRYSITAVGADFDNDGWPDIYVAVDSQPSILFRNNHDGTFTDVAVIAGCAYSENGHEQAGMGVGVADYDCDGWLDIFKTNFADDTCNLYHNNGDGTFSDVTFASGIGVNNQYVAWGCGFVDYDNDGWADIIQVNGHVYPELAGHEIGQSFKNPRLVYKNLGNGQFKDVSSAMGTGINERYSSRGAAFGDFDNDGGIDVLVLNMNDMPSLLRNDGGNQQNWIKIKLIGTKCNRTAIGARVRVVTGNHSQIDEVRSGSSVMSQSDLRLHFGLGKAHTVDLIEVKWPTTQKIERFTQVKANQILTIREGNGIMQPPPASTKAAK
jgi:enediyne biosynthesis protein E4